MRWIGLIIRQSAFRGKPGLNDLVQRWRWYLVAILSLPFLIGSVLMVERELDAPAPLVIESQGQGDADLKVYVVGAVANPGVYEIGDGKRWIDALEAAGGPTNDANLLAINLARQAVDEDHIIVPSLSDPASAIALASPGLININTASQAELEELPGIGEVRAGNIIQSRTVDGPFGSPEDLLSRDLIPPSVFEDIAILITVY